MCQICKVETKENSFMHRFILSSCYNKTESLKICCYVIMRKFKTYLNSCIILRFKHITINFFFVLFPYFPHCYLGTTHGAVTQILIFPFFIIFFFASLEKRKEQKKAQKNGNKNYEFKKWDNPFSIFPFVLQENVENALISIIKF